MVSEQASKLTLHWLLFRLAAGVLWAIALTWGLKKLLNEDIQFFWIYIIMFVAIPIIFGAINWVNTYIGHEMLFGKRLEEIVFNDLKDSKMPVMTGPFDGWVWEEYLTAVIEWPGSTKQHCMVAAATAAEIRAIRNVNRLSARLSIASLNAAVNRYIRMHQDQIDPEFDSWLTKNDEMALMRSRYTGM